jgi:dienelactone hydrolase
MGNRLVYAKATVILLMSLPTIWPAASSNPLPKAADSRTGKLFTYERRVPFELSEASTRKESGVIVRDVSYASYGQRHGRIKAYIVKPDRAGPHAGVVFFHWLGRFKSDRTQFLDEAVTLAQHGVVSILIQGFFPWLEPPTEAKADRQRVIDQTIEVRRAFDLLLAQPGVDPKRLGFVGHDYGAMYGSIVAGLDKRAKAFVLIAGLGNFGDWSLKYWPVTGNQGAETYRQIMMEVDPIQYISSAKHAKLLFQFAQQDIFISKSAADQFYGAASERSSLSGTTPSTISMSKLPEPTVRSGLPSNLGSRGEDRDAMSPALRNEN